MSRHQPTQAEKEDFISQLAIAEDKGATAESRKAAEVKLAAYIKTFDCGCDFRDRMFKLVYKSAKSGNRTLALKYSLQILKSFKYDSLRGIVNRVLRRK